MVDAIPSIGFEARDTFIMNPRDSVQSLSLNVKLFLILD